jgi:hypothetical protein
MTTYILQLNLNLHTRHRGFLEFRKTLGFYKILASLFQEPWSCNRNQIDNQNVRTDGV